MTKLKQSFLNKLALSALVLLVCGDPSAYAANDLALTKDLVGPAGGVALQGGDFSLNFAWGEAAAGTLMSYAGGTEDPGYYGGRFGVGQTFSVLNSLVGGTTTYFQNGLQIGVTVQSPVEITFSDLLDPDSIPSGLSGTILQDHLSNPQNIPVALEWTYDPAGRTLVVSPKGLWRGNTVYDIAVSPGLNSMNGYALDTTTHVRFLTMADPHEPNVVTNALGAVSTGAQPLGSLAVNAMPSLDLGSDALSDYSVFLFNTTPLQTPWNVDPAVLREATAKAQVSGGTYQTPVRLIEIAVFNPEGKRLSGLSQPAQIAVPFDSSSNWVTGSPVPVHASSLALWALDPEHRLWVKIPTSSATGQTVSAPITRFSVFALMGSALGVASDVFVFPNPWRPSGPQAGDSSGQSGTSAGGMTFSNLPSECSIKIYTLNGDLVRELNHSDTVGPIAQEKWDGNTTGGAHAASGVYLWRVESSQDSKNGKLIIIR